MDGGGELGDVVGVGGLPLGEGVEIGEEGVELFGVEGVEFGVEILFADVDVEGYGAIVPEGVGGGVGEVLPFGMVVGLVFELHGEEVASYAQVLIDVLAHLLERGELLFLWFWLFFRLCGGVLWGFVVGHGVEPFAVL